MYTEVLIGNLIKIIDPLIRVSFMIRPFRIFFILKLKQQNPFSSNSGEPDMKDMHTFRTNKWQAHKLCDIWNNYTLYEDYLLVKCMRSKY